MATLQELQERNQALKAAAQAGAVPESPATKNTSTIPPTPETNSLQSQFQTGLQSSAESAGSTFVPPTAEPEVAEIDAEKAKESLGVFRATQLRKFFVGATEVRPENGYFYARSYHQLKDLAHFAVLGKVEQVELPKPEEKKD